MADRDMSDMFLNFQLHHSVVPFTGVDLRPIYESGGDGVPVRVLGHKPHGTTAFALCLRQGGFGGRGDLQGR